MTEQEKDDLKRLNAKRRKVHRLSDDESDYLNSLRVKEVQSQWAKGVKLIDML